LPLVILNKLPVRETLNCIARWDGTHWQPLGSGVTYANGNDAYIMSIEVYHDELYVSGYFDNINGNQFADHFAKWNGSAWSVVGNNITAVINDMKVYNDKLYLAGAFSGGGILAYWDGLNMFSLGLNMPGTAEALEIFGDTLYFGGSLHLVVTNGDTAVNIAALDLKSVPTHVQNEKEKPLPLVYPNPVSEYISLQIAPSINFYRLEIRNIQGVLCYEQEMKSCSSTIRINFLPPGIYTISVVSNNERYIGKFIKE